MDFRRYSTGSYLDNLHGYEDSFEVEDFLEDGHQMNLNIINLSMATTRSVSTQTEFVLSYPDLYAQALREVSLRHFSDIGGYVNVPRNRSRSTSGVIAEEIRAGGGNNYVNLLSREPPAKQRLEDSLDARVSRWIDQELDLVTNRVSNSTVYEDIEDIVSVVQVTVDGGRGDPPPLPPRLRRSTSVSGGPRSNKKNLYEHFGLDNFSQSTFDVASAQKIALDNLRQSEGTPFQSRKDLNKFLGICESSPVKMRPEKRRSPSSRNSRAFFDNLISGKLFRGRRESAEVNLARPEVVDSPCHKSSEEFSDTDSYEKSRTSSFSSTKSSVSSSMFSMTSSSSRYEVTTRSSNKDFLNPFRRRSGGSRRRSAAANLNDYRRSLDVEDEFVKFSRSSTSPPSSADDDAEKPGTSAPFSNLNQIGRSLDAVIHLAQLELNRTRSRAYSGLNRTRSSVEESIYMEMSTSNSDHSDVYMDMSTSNSTKSDIYMDMNALNNLSPN